MSKTMARLQVGACAILIAPLMISCSTRRIATTRRPTSRLPPRSPRSPRPKQRRNPKPPLPRARSGDGGLPAGALARKAMLNPNPALTVDTDALDAPHSYAEQDWQSTTRTARATDRPPS